MAKAPAPSSRAAAKKVAPTVTRKASGGTAAKKATAEKTATATKKTVAKKAPIGTKKAVAKKTVVAKKAPEKKAVAKKAPGKKAARSPFRAAWLRTQEAALVEERAIYTRQADSLQAEADALVADFQSGDAQFDEDGGEGDTLSSERERDLTLSAQARAAIEEIDHALTKFALGTYGICEASGDPIPAERLEAIPWARVQVQYKTGGLGRL